MRISTTRPIVTAITLATAAALVVSGCGAGGGRAGKGANPASSTPAAVGGDDDTTPMSQTGGDDMVKPDDMMKAKPMTPMTPTDAPSESHNDKMMAPENDSGRPGKVGPSEPHGSALSSGAAAAQAKVHKKRLPVQRSPRIGRIFGKAGRLTWFCSASVVPSHGKNLIVTAGHCLWDEHDGHALSHDWTFVPGYFSRGGKAYAPYGIYTASHWWAYKSWVHHQNWRYDFAFMKLRRGQAGYRGAGRNVENNVGSMGIAWNLSPNRTYAPIGYDAEHKYGWDNGCCAYYRKGSGHWNGAWAQLVMNHRFLTGGASGGPWLIQYNRKKRIGYVDGINSRSDRVSDASSAYFGSALRRLYYKVR